MKKKIVSCVLLSFLGSLACSLPIAHADMTAQVRDRIWLRQKFHSALDQSVRVDAAVMQIEQSGVLSASDRPAIVMAYYGAMKGLQARDSRNLAQKWCLLQLCFQWMDRALQRDPGDLEVRFVRFATLHNLPGFLVDSQARKQDADQVCLQLQQKDFSVVDQQTQIEMIQFMLASDRLSAQQSSDLKELLSTVSPL